MNRDIGVECGSLLERDLRLETAVNAKLLVEHCFLALSIVHVVMCWQGSLTYRRFSSRAIRRMIPTIILSIFLSFSLFVRWRLQRWPKRWASSEGNSLFSLWPPPVPIPSRVVLPSIDDILLTSSALILRLSSSLLVSLSYTMVR